MCKNKYDFFCEHVKIGHYNLPIYQSKLDSFSFVIIQFYTILLKYCSIGTTGEDKKMQTRRSDSRIKKRSLYNRSIETNFFMNSVIFS